MFTKDTLYVLPHCGLYLFLYFCLFVFSWLIIVTINSLKYIIVVLFSSIDLGAWGGGAGAGVREGRYMAELQSVPAFLAAFPYLCWDLTSTHWSLQGPLSRIMMHLLINN